MMAATVAMLRKGAVSILIGTGITGFRIQSLET